MSASTASMALVGLGSNERRSSKSTWIARQVPLSDGNYAIMGGIGERPWDCPPSESSPPFFGRRGLLSLPRDVNEEWISSSIVGNPDPKPQVEGGRLNPVVAAQTTEP